MTDTTSDIFDFQSASNRRSFALLAIGAIIGLGIAGYGLFTAKGTATNAVPPEYVAIVNQRPIYRSDFDYQIQTTLSIPTAQATVEQKQKTLLDMINEELLVQRGLDEDLSSYDSDVRAALVAGVENQLYADVLAKEPTDDELKAYYQAHRNEYASLGMMQLRDLQLQHTGSETPEENQQRLTDAIAALRKGTPVDAVMQKFRLMDSGYLRAGGKTDTDMIFNFAAEAKLPPKVFAAAMKLKPGEISDVVNDVEGDHIIVMADRRQSQDQTFEDVRSRVWNDIKKEEQDHVLNSTLQYLRSKSAILTGKI